MIYEIAERTHLKASLYTHLARSERKMDHTPEHKRCKTKAIFENALRAILRHNEKLNAKPPNPRFQVASGVFAPRENKKVQKRTQIQNARKSILDCPFPVPHSEQSEGWGRDDGRVAWDGPIRPVGHDDFLTRSVFICPPAVPKGGCNLRTRTKTSGQ